MTSQAIIKINPSVITNDEINEYHDALKGAMTYLYLAETTDEIDEILSALCRVDDHIGLLPEHLQTLHYENDNLFIVEHN